MKRIHYAWAVCAGAALLLFCTSGLTVNAFTVYQPYILRLNGFTNAQTSTLLTVRSLFGFAGMLLVGAYYRHLSLRNGMALAGLTVALGFVLFGLATPYWSYCLAAAVTGVGYGLGTMVPVAIVIDHWFLQKRTLALGICTASTGLSTLGFPSLITHLIESIGLKSTFLLEALFIALASGAVWLLVRDRPEDKALAPYGKLPQLRQRMRDGNGQLEKQNWILLVPMLLCLGAMTSVAYSHIAVLAAGEGYAPHTAALAVTVSGLTMTAAKLVYGGLCDRLGTYRCNRIFGAILTAGMVLCCLIRGGTGILFAAMCLYGAGLAMTTVGLTAWAGDWSGTADYDKNVRRFQIGYTAGGLLFSSLPGILADHFAGSYIPAYAFFVACTLFVVLSVQHTYRKKRKKALKIGEY